MIVFREIGDGDSALAYSPDNVQDPSHISHTRHSKIRLAEKYPI